VNSDRWAIQICRALADRLKQANQRVGRPLLVRATVGVSVAADRVSIFNEKFGFGPHERPL
jgi:hypothetical protein